MASNAPSNHSVNIFVCVKTSDKGLKTLQDKPSNFLMCDHIAKLYFFASISS